MPDRHARIRAAAVEAPSTLESVGLVVASLARVAMRRPVDTVGTLMVLGLSIATLVNALYMQSGRHPAPLLGPMAPSQVKETTGSVIAAPRPRPAPAQAGHPEPPPPVVTHAAEGKRTPAQLNTELQQELARRGFYEAAIDGVYGPRMDAAIREFEEAAKLRVTGEPSDALLKALLHSKIRSPRGRPPASAHGREHKTAAPDPAPSRRVIAAQRALSDFGYGQLKLTGVVDSPTRAAIEKFERERKLPVKGQITDRLMRELAAVTGRPLE